MREIKFRVWNEKKGYYNMNEIHYVLGSLVSGKLVFANEQEKLNDIIEQYTGLKDKNGVEIYEGDIVNSETYGEMNVIYCDGAFMMSDDKYGVLLFEQDQDEQGNLVYIEVIGNIHEEE